MRHRGPDPPVVFLLPAALLPSPGSLPAPVSLALGAAAVLSPVLTAYYLLRAALDGAADALGVEAAPTSATGTTPPDPAGDGAAGTGVLAAASGRWWLVLAVYAAANVCVLLVAVVAVAVRPLAGVLFGPLAAAGAALTALQFAAPVAFHLDDRAVRAGSDWTPSGVYYLTVVHFLGPVLAARYLHRRHCRLGTP